MSEDKRVKEAIALSLTAGYQLDRDAFDFLSLVAGTEDPVKLVEVALERVKRLGDNPLFINRVLLEESAKDAFPESRGIETLSTPLLTKPERTGKARESFYPLAKDIEKDVDVIEDPTEKTRSAGSVEDYLGYFQDRFKRITRLLRQRMDSRNAGTLRDAFRAPAGSKVKVICMVTEKRESKYGTALRVEDLEDCATVLMPRNGSTELSGRAKTLLLDQVVCLGLLKTKKNLLIIEELLFPDIPQNKPQKAKERVYAALISDLHVGSREFMREEFTRFVLWLNGKCGDEGLKEAAGLVKYVVIAGDVVDGVGIYPNQVKELVLRDVFKQYRVAARFIEQIPDYIEVIVIPGNHDASRKALPQPAIPKEYAEPIHEARDIWSLGNPATVRLHGVEFLIYHGRSLDDILATAADMDFHSPERAMRVMLQSRHLAPTYGQRTSIAPEKRDFLVIERVPAVFHAGHVHVMKYESYRGTLMVNSGAWQRQTNYQRNLGLDPTPGIFPVVDLQSLAVLPVELM